MPIVRNIHTNDLYRYNGENNFTNLRTGISGFVPDDKAQNVFRINLDATEMIAKYPQVETLITTLRLSFFEETLNNK